MASGEPYLQPALGVSVARWLSRPPESGGVPHDQLSTTETEIMRLLVLGHTNAEIARRALVSLRTVETQRAHVIHRLGCQHARRARAVRAGVTGCSTSVSDATEFALTGSRYQWLTCNHQKKIAPKGDGKYPTTI